MIFLINTCHQVFTVILKMHPGYVYHRFACFNASQFLNVGEFRGQGDAMNGSSTQPDLMEY